MVEVWSNALLPKMEAGRYLLKDIKCIMVQSSGVNSDTANQFYDKISEQPFKKTAHVVIDSSNIVHYNYMDSSSFIENVLFTDVAKSLLVDPLVAGDDPARHIFIVDICINNTDNEAYKDIEINAIKWLAQFLVSNGLNSSHVWRRSSLVNDYIIEAGISTPAYYPPQYNNKEDWDKFLSQIETATTEIKSGTPDWTKITGSETDVTVNDLWESDQRLTNLITSKIDIKQLENMDFEITTIGGVTTKKDKFTNQVTTQGDPNVYEPIYPDLTVPPKSSTSLYNEPFENIKQLNKKKLVLGKPVNNDDPYPVDDKIEELELHYPIVKIDDSALNEMQNNPNSIPTYLMNLSNRAEKRIVQLENLLSTMSRYLFRVGSRININCVYYGGQSTFGKYNCIRCMQDDLINDSQIVQLDQCLNCSRYEPIVGQVYEILSDDGKLNLDSAVILDDNQAARMTMEDRIKFSRVEEFVDEEEDASNDKNALNKKDPDDKSLNELAQDNQSFIMQWIETPLPQTPDISEYSYDHKKIMDQKEEILKPEAKYYDGYKDVIKKTISNPVNNYANSPISNVSSSYDLGISNGGYATVNDYDWTGLESLKSVVETAIELGEFGKSAKAGYVFGGKVKETYILKTPNELYDLLMSGEQPMVKYSSEGTPIRTDALGFDCSGLSSYVYTLNGIEFSGSSRYQFKHYCTPVGKLYDRDDCLKHAIPGDIVFFGANAEEISHVTIYIGGGEYVGADTAHAPKDSQVRRNKVYKENFFCIARHKANTILPKLKSVKHYDVGLTLEEAAQKQLSKSTGYAGKDNTSTTIEEVKSYLDPANHFGEVEKYQFYNLGAPNGMTLEEIKNLLKQKNAAQALIDSADAYIEAANKYGISEIYLIAHSGHESGWGKSTLSNGSYTGPTTGRPIYNMYGIKAFNSDPERINARKYSEDHKWFSVREAIIGGAEFIARDYISVGQNTLYKMRWNFPSCTHQYATDVGWAVKQTSTIASILDDMPQEIKSKYIFDIPQFKL